VRHRFLLSARLRAAAGIILKSTVLIPAADPLFRYAVLQRPSIYLAFIWSFAIFLFTTPFLMLSMCFSLLYIHFYEQETARVWGPCLSILNRSIARTCSSSWVNYITRSKLLPPHTRNG
jgi:hypothetical protein